MNYLNIPKRIGLVTLLLFFTVIVFAQKPNMRNIKISYTQFPLQPLDENIKTYNSALSMDVTLQNTDIDKLNNQYLKLYGYKKNKDQSDVFINAKFGKFQINKELITGDVFNVNQGKNITGYYYKISCEYPVSFSLTSKDGKIIFEQVIKHNEKRLNQNFGKWTYSIDELNTKFDAKRSKFFPDLKNKCDKKDLSEIKNVLSSNFSYLPVTKKIKIASGKGKKFDYSDLESAFQYMEKAFEMISSKSASEDVNTELNKAIAIWENALNESSHNKKTRINEPVSTMLYYNIGIAYWWMLDFAKAHEYIDKALKYNLACRKPSSSNEKLINKAIENINDYDKRLTIHGKL